MEKVLISILGRDESEPFVTDETLDGAIHRHVDFLDVSALIRDETSMIPANAIAGCAELHRCDYS